MLTRRPHSSRDLLTSHDTGLLQGAPHSSEESNVAHYKYLKVETFKLDKSSRQRLSKSFIV